MSIQNRPKSWTFRAPLGTQINWGHSLAKGLVSCFLLNEGAGKTCTDLASGGIGTIQHSTTDTWRTTPYGVGFFTNVDTPIGQIAETHATISWPLTAVCIFLPQDVTLANNGLVSHDNVGQTVGWDMRTLSANPGFSSSGVGSIAFNNFTMVNNKVYFYAVTVIAGTAKLIGYMASLGGGLTIQTDPNTWSTVGNPTRVTVAFSGSTGTRNCLIFQAMIYNRIL